MAVVLTGSPFAIVYANVINIISTSSHVLELVDAENIIRYDTELSPLIDARNMGDLPSLDLPFTGFEDQNLWHTTSTAQFIMGIRLIYKTSYEHLAADTGIWQLQWAFLRALFNGGVNCGLPDLVESWELSTFEAQSPMDQVTYPETLDEQGWQAVSDLSILIKLQHTELR